MRYTLDMTTQKKVPVTNIVVDGRPIFRPTDEQIDEAGIGYPYEYSEPDVGELSATQRLVHAYTIDDGVIKDVWAVESITPQELVQLYKGTIDKLNADSEDYKNNGSIVYNGKGYRPRWVFEFYNAMINLNQMVEMFPCDIAADDGTSSTFTYEEFLQLFAFISMTFAEYTRAINAQIADLNRQIALLEDA